LLFFDNDTLLESSGLYGSSSLHLIDLATGEIFNNKRNNKNVFAEGCAIVEINGQQTIFQLT